MDQTLWIIFVSINVLWHSAVSQPSDTVFECPDPGDVPALYPDPASCEHFYQCAHVGTPLEFSARLACPEGLSFNTAAKVCDWPFNVQCDNGVRPTPTAPSTEEPDGSGDGEVVVPSDPSNHLSTEGTTDRKEGTSSEIDEEFIPVTTSRQTMTQASTTTPAATTSASVTRDADEPFKCPPGSSDKLFRDIKNCRNYFQCAHVGTVFERVYKMRCPSGLVFNKEKQYCDWRRNVPDCSLTGRNAESGR